MFHLPSGELSQFRREPLQHFFLLIISLCLPPQMLRQMLLLCFIIEMKGGKMQRGVHQLRRGRMFPAWQDTRYDPDDVRHRVRRTSPPFKSDWTDLQDPRATYPTSSCYGYKSLVASMKVWIWSTSRIHYMPLTAESWWGLCWPGTEERCFGHVCEGVN